MRKLLYVLCCFLCGVADGAPLEPIKLKGLSPGMTIAEAEALVPGFAITCAALDAPDLDATCVYAGARTISGRQHPELDRYADNRVNSWRFVGRESRLHAIVIAFEPDNFIEICTALSAKYGKPKTSSEMVSNRMNAKFENVIVVWRRGAQTLTARRFAGDIETSSLILTDSNFKKLVKAPSKDL